MRRRDEFPKEVPGAARFHTTQSPSRRIENSGKEIGVSADKVVLANSRVGKMGFPEIAPRGRQMLHTMNSTNAMPISSTKKATESYSSQMPTNGNHEFPSCSRALFLSSENRWAHQSNLDVDQIAVLRDPVSIGSYQCPLSA
jgi:hypothetical protein